ncbi:MAG: GAF domain-containing protein [Hydrogenophaga sp.]|uniref:helix-turn-helix domain-containing protein n=1 Tax=Hydrogenophaga sp. TaxID=1904254 RepID=UPI002627EBCA|nr:helix-turn-helix domain-containing protein [Hydrogenophaga sp.]MDM7941584.1 GAF domain-containing protein [Hydrogenophaga sp.]
MHRPSYDPDDLDDPDPAVVGAALTRSADPVELASLRLQVAQSRDRERAWRAVADTARDLTVLREPAGVLQAIVERSRALLGSHIGWIAGPDVASEDDLVVLAIDGVTAEWAQLMRVAHGRGAAGYVRRTRSPFATADYFADERVIHDAQIDATLRGEGLLSMVAVPMLSGTDFIGVLVLADRVVREYTHPDIATLGMLAAQAVVAVRNAQAHAQTRRALAQAEFSNQRLQQQTEALEMAADAHERLTRLVARGGTQLDVCRTVASLLGAEVVVVDDADTVLCMAGSDGVGVSGAGGSLARWLQGLQLHAALDDSRLSGRSVAMAAPPGRMGRLAAIVGGSRLLGGLLVLSAEPLSDVAVRTLERSALVVALMLLAPRLTVDSQAADSEHLLADLLNPMRLGSAALAGRAAARGLTSGTATVLALLEVTAMGSAAGATTTAVQRRLQARLDDPRARVCEMDGRVVVLCADRDPAALRQTMLKALDEKPRLTAVGLVSARCDTLAVLPDSFAGLHKGLVLLRMLASEDLTAKACIRLVDELAPFVAAFGNNAAVGGPAPQTFIDATVGALLAHDRTRGTKLATSLLTYLDLGCSAKAAASRLGLHINTLRNRLAAADALLGPWDLPGRRLALHLALQLHALRSPSSNLG